MNRSFLKWAGGKYRLLKNLLPLFPEGERFVEPFVGSGVVFINVNYPSYLINDVNEDLIGVYKSLWLNPEEYIKSLSNLFSAPNTSDIYYYNRSIFNNANMYYELNLKSLLFVYLNRHCFNGLCRYNKKGKFNVAFGKYKNVYFPEKELKMFAQKLQNNTEISNVDYKLLFKSIGKGDVVYCDPPYVSLSKTSNFTNYFGKSFGDEEQIHLVSLIKKAVNKGATVLISNHDTEFTRELYNGANIISFDTPRLISPNGNRRTKVKELIAIFGD
jgi:DNA adenine methylase